MPKFTMTDTVYLNTFRKTLLELKKKTMMSNVHILIFFVGFHAGI